MIRQRTLKSLVRAIGVGVHSGNKVEIVLRPAGEYRLFSDELI